MAKKIYDIKPPKVAKKIKEPKQPAKKEISSVTIKRKKKTELPKEADFIKDVDIAKIESPTISPIIQRNYIDKRKPIILGGILILAIIGIYLFFKLPKAEIAIWPNVEVLSFQQSLSADKSVESINISGSVIPAKYFEAEKTNSQDFPSTGSASDAGKAKGTITVYNKYSPPESFTFKAGTRFMSDSGKIFVALQKVVIPAAKKSGSKITPSSVQIQVEAVEGGTDYNIGPSSFSVPGLKGTAYYYSIYAESKNDMSGGYSGKVKKVTDDDIQGAKDVLIKKTTEDSISDLKSQITSDYILLDNAVLHSVTDASTKAKIGTIADNFTYQVTVKASALVFKKSDIEQFAKDYISSQIPEGKALLDNTFKIDYSATTVDVSGGKAIIDLNCSEGIYRDIDKNSISISLMGENEEQIKKNINSSIGDDISKIEVKFWPFWVNKAPNSQKAIKVDLKF